MYGSVPASRRNKRKTDPTLWVLLIYFALFILLFKLSPTILGALTLGWYLSMIIEVPAKALGRIRFIPYRAAIVISALLVFTLLLAGISQLFPILADEGKKLILLLVKAAGDLNLEEIVTFRNELLREQVLKIANDFISNLSTQVAAIGSSALNWIIQTAPNFITAVLLFVIAASYFTALVPLIRKNLWRFFPYSGRKKAVAFVVDYYGNLRHFIRGQLIIALLVGLIVGGGMFIVGIPYALFLGFLSGITNFIPFLGVIIAGLPAVLLGLTHGGLWGLVKVLIVLAVANQLESWVLSPKIQGKRMKLNWFLIVIAIFFLAQFLGVVGVLLAIPWLVFFRQFWIDYVQNAFRRL